MSVAVQFIADRGNVYQRSSRCLRERLVLPVGRQQIAEGPQEQGTKGDQNPRDGFVHDSAS